MKKGKLIALLLAIFVICALAACKPVKTKDTVQLAAPTLTVSEKIVSWRSVENAEEYEVFVNGKSVGKQEGLFYTLNETTVGEYTITVKALSSNSAYTASEMSEAATITIAPTKLEEPFLTSNETTFTWDAVENAEKYEVFVDGQSVGEQTECTYTLTLGEYKTYTVQVKAITTNTQYANSGLSNEKTYVYAMPKVSAPILEVEGESISWLTSEKVASYEVYFDGDKIATVTEGHYAFEGTAGIHSVYVKAIPKDTANYLENQSETISLTIEAVTDFTKDIYVYSKNLENRLSRYVLGIADASNYSTLNPNYKNALDTFIDNYLANFPVEASWGDEEYAQFAWKLEAVAYDMTKDWVYADYPVYRIRLTDGYYLTVAKNNVIKSPDGDYICESEYVENDIWQYWQFVPKAGCKNEYYIYSVGHGYDWSGKNHYLTDTSRNNGGAELYPMDETNEYYFVYRVLNVTGATFAEVQHKDYSGNYTISNFINANVYAPIEGLVKATDHDASAIDGTEVWTLEKVADKNTYKVKFTDGKYLCMYNYELYATDAAGAHEFYFYEVAGMKNGFKLCGGLDIDFCLFTDGNDNQQRRFVYADNGGGTPSRQWGSIDWRNDMGRYWVLTPFDGNLPIAKPVLTNDGNVFTWNAVDKASAYEVYVDGELADTVTETTYTLTPTEMRDYKVYVIALTTEEGFTSSKSNEVSYAYNGALDFTKPIYVYNTHLVARYQKCVLGIADQSNYSTLSDSRKATLDNYIDNFLTNIEVGAGWTNADYVKYAWQLEKVTYDTTKSWVHGDYPVYRIRLVSGFYLTVAKNNIIGTSADYICESELNLNDIWQMWQFVPVEGKTDEFYLYNLGHGYDWNKPEDYVADSTSADGHAEFFTKDSSNAEWFTFKVENIEGAVFADEKHIDYSGTYAVSNFINTNLYAPDSENGLIKATTHGIADMTAADVWTLEKVAGKNSYKIKLGNGKYLCMNGYELYATDATGAQDFCVIEVAGLKNGFIICGALDIDFCLFTDGNDGQQRRFVYSDGGNGTPSRQWGSIDWRNDMGRYWIFKPVSST